MKGMKKIFLVLFLAAILIFPLTVIANEEPKPEVIPLDKVFSGFQICAKGKWFCFKEKIIHNFLVSFPIKPRKLIISPRLAVFAPKEEKKYEILMRLFCTNQLTNILSISAENI